MSILVNNLNKSYMISNIGIDALKNVSTEIKDQTFTIIYGKSQSGKSVFLDVLSGKIEADSGKVYVNDQLYQKMTLDEKKIFVDQTFGLITHEFKLLESTNVLDNIKNKRLKINSNLDLDKLLKVCRLDKISGKYPFQLGNLERQKVSIAREILNNPNYLFLDDPIRSFNELQTKEILSILEEMIKVFKMTVIMTTQNENILGISDHIIAFESGQIVKDVLNDNKVSVKDLILS